MQLQFHPYMILNSPALHTLQPKGNSKEDSYKKEVLNDLWVCLVSRELSYLGRREVLTGKAKFGVFGAGKEVAQVAMARSFKKGDYRSGYYRDQTFMLALGLCTVEDFLAQLYADAENDPFSAGRQMPTHFATKFINENDEWLPQVDHFNITSDISCTAGQMARAIGLSRASKAYREVNVFGNKNKFSDNGNEVCFCTIGDASTSEGAFWETLNAAAVMKTPLAVSVWDDGYGISVPVELQTVKGNISRALEGFLLDEDGKGMYISTVKGHDYPGLCATYENVIKKVRENHIPALIHVQDMTQPQGHSTSGSHERYKSSERLQWEKDFDCIELMINWIKENGIAEDELINQYRTEAKQYVKKARDNAWGNYRVKPVAYNKAMAKVYAILDQYDDQAIQALKKDFENLVAPSYHEILRNARRLNQHITRRTGIICSELNEILEDGVITGDRYHTNLTSPAETAAENIKEIPAEYSDSSESLNGFEVINKFFELTFKKRKDVFAFGEDVGNIGDVNQGFAGLQAKFGQERIFDTGIREWTIVGQAIGMSMRGLRPIAEIQYLDYLVYGLTPLTDDLATLRWRSNGLQMAPAIIRTRGHRLEGVWHSGSPLGMMINSLRGIHILVPRDLVRAAGFYNTMLSSTDPAIVIECLNGYRLKERVPDNLGEFTVPLGIPEVLQEGDDITLVTYGTCVRIAQQAIEQLEAYNVSVELIDVQSLLPFDIHHKILESVKKTNRILFLDEDVPGGATAFMMKEVLETQGAYYHLDATPATLTAKAHRPPYGSDGDYFTKPNAEDVFDKVMEIIEQ